MNFSPNRYVNSNLFLPCHVDYKNILFIVKMCFLVYKAKDINVLGKIVFFCFSIFCHEPLKSTTNKNVVMLTLI